MDTWKNIVTSAEQLALSTGTYSIDYNCLACLKLSIWGNTAKCCSLCKHYPKSHLFMCTVREVCNPIVTCAAFASLYSGLKLELATRTQGPSNQLYRLWSLSPSYTSRPEMQRQLSGRCPPPPHAASRLALFRSQHQGSKQLKKETKPTVTSRSPRNHQ